MSRVLDDISKTIIPILVIELFRIYYFTIGYRDRNETASSSEHASFTREITDEIKRKRVKLLNHWIWTNKKKETARFTRYE